MDEVAFSFEDPPALTLLPLTYFTWCHAAEGADEIDWMWWYVWGMQESLMQNLLETGLQMMHFLMLEVLKNFVGGIH